MLLQENKQTALKIIEQYNDAINTCLNQNNITALEETYELRNELIKQFFENYSSLLNQKDQEFFEDIKTLDANVLIAMRTVKDSVVTEVTINKKKRSGITAYQTISKEK